MTSTSDLMSSLLAEMKEICRKLADAQKWLKENQEDKEKRGSTLPPSPTETPILPRKEVDTTALPRAAIKLNEQALFSLLRIIQGSKNLLPEEKTAARSQIGQFSKKYEGTWENLDIRIMMGKVWAHLGN